MEIALLSQDKSIKELVEVDVNKSILEFIEVELSKDEFNFIVTAENMPKAKKVMADLNKNIDFVTKFRKEKVNLESEDIDSFKSNVKEYVALIDKKRDEIKKNVEVFEREAKSLITKELSLYADEAIKNAKLRYDFSKVDTADLIVLGSVTAKGALTKKATETINGRVLACKSKQDKYDMRLMDLENQSHRAKLESPLTITHVQGIIYLDDDEVYQNNLNELIRSEIDRQDIIKASLKKDADEKAQGVAHQEVLDGQNRISSIFNSIATDNSLSIDEKIHNASNYDFKQFAQLEEFARAKSQSVVSELNNLKKSLENAQKSTTVTIADKEVEVTHETIAKDTPKVEDGKKVVLIDVHLQFKVKDTIPNDKIVAKVNQMLTTAGFDESLIGVEVVS